jgi:hypothetical protein
MPHIQNRLLFRGVIDISESTYILNNFKKVKNSTKWLKGGKSGAALFLMWGLLDQNGLVHTEPSLSSTLIKKKIKFSSYIRKFRMEQLQSHIWLNICAFPHILGSPSSYLTLQLLHFEFPYILGKI